MTNTMRLEASVLQGPLKKYEKALKELVRTLTSSQHAYLDSFHLPPDHITPMDKKTQKRRTHSLSS